MTLLAVSNIAWSQDNEASIIPVLRQGEVNALEIAPTTIWPEPTLVSRGELRDYAAAWERRGCPIRSLQSLVYARPHLRLFGTTSERAEFQQYLTMMCELAATIGARRLVFGSPKNRQRGDLDEDAAFDIATEFFSELGVKAARRDIQVVIEPNAPAYGCDFITNADEGQRLVTAVDSPGIGLHLDVGCMTLAGDDPYDAVAQAGTLLGHFHVSEPQLQPVDTDSVGDHRAAARGLDKITYDEIISIEMRSVSPEGQADALRRAISFVRDIYFPVEGKQP